MPWKTILKEEPEWKKRLKRMEDAKRGKYSQAGRRRKNKCDRCGRRMSASTRYETRAGSTVCHTCRKQDKMGG